MRPGFLNDNMNRSYPFLLWEEGGLPDYVIADFGCQMNAGSGFIAGTHKVYLAKVSSDGAVVTFEFHSDAPGLSELALFFRRSVADAHYVASYADAEPRVSVEDTSSSSSSSSVVAECDVESAWTGFLVTGDLPRFSDYIGTSQIQPSADVEPSVIHNTDGAYVRTVNVANAERTRATTREDCRDYCWDFPQYDHYVACSCLIGDIRLKEGFNASIRQDPISNTIVIDAAVGAGAGQPCDEVPLFEGETPPPNRTTLDGAPRCNEVVRSINGIGKRFFSITGGNGVVVTPVPDQNKVIVSADMQDLAICPDFRELGSSLASVPVNEDPCDCGGVLPPVVIPPSSSISSSLDYSSSSISSLSYAETGLGLLQIWQLQRNPPTGPATLAPTFDGAYNLGSTKVGEIYRLALGNAGTGPLAISLSHSGSLFEGLVTGSPDVIPVGFDVSYYDFIVRSTPSGAASSVISITHDGSSHVSPFTFTVNTDAVGAA